MLDAGTGARAEGACLQVQEAWRPGSIPGREDPLEEGMAPTPAFLPGESHGQSPGGLQSMEVQRVGDD